MGKLLFWVIVILGALMVARILTRQAEKRDHPAPGLEQTTRKGWFGKRSAAGQPGKGSAPATEPEAMVRCAHCGIHLPRSDALLVNDQTWCSQEHARLGSTNT